MHPLSTPWKHQKTVKFSDVFKGERKNGLGTNELRDECSLMIIIQGVCVCMEIGVGGALVTWNKF